MTALPADEGNDWVSDGSLVQAKCEREDCALHVVRPGKIRCYRQGCGENPMTFMSAADRGEGFRVATFHLQAQAKHADRFSSTTSDVLDSIVYGLKEE